MTSSAPLEIRFAPVRSAEDGLRFRRDEVRFVIVPERRVLAIDGQSSPDGPAFRAAIAALYPVAYAIHFTLRKRGVEAPIGPLEGLWWEAREFQGANWERVLAERESWRWTLLLNLPAEARDDEIDAAIEALRRKSPGSEVDRLRVESFDEGASAQAMHVGPYSAELETIERLHGAIAAAGLRPRRRHHEIYLGDPRRSDPKRLRTLIRQPVE